MIELQPKKVVDFLNAEFRPTSEQVAAIIYQTYQKYLFWNDGYSLVNFDTPSWKYSWRPLDEQALPGMLSVPYVGFTCTSMKRWTKNDGLVTHNAISPFLPGKTFLGIDVTDYPCLINAGKKFSVHYYPDLLELKYDWYIKSLENRKHEFDIQYLETPMNLSIANVPLRVTLPNLLVDLMKAKIGCSSTAELMAYIRMRQLYQSGKPNFEIFSWKGVDYINAVYRLRSIIVNRDEEPKASEVEAKNNTFLYWKGGISTTAIVEVPFRHFFVTEDSVMAKAMSVAKNNNTVNIDIEIPSVALDTVDYRNTDYSAEFVRLLTIHMQKFIPAEIVQARRDENLVGGNVRNKGIDQASGLPTHWRLKDGTPIESFALSSSVNQAGETSFTITALKSGVFAMTTTVFNDLPNTGQRINLNIEAFGKGIVALFPSDTIPNSQGNLISKPTIYTEEYVQPNDIPGLTFMVRLMRGESCTINHIGMYFRNINDFVISFKETFGIDFQHLIKWLSVRKEANLENILRFGVHNVAGKTYTDKEFSIDWENFALRFPNIENSNVLHQLIIKATNRFEEEFKQFIRTGYDNDYELYCERMRPTL